MVWGRSDPSAAQGVWVHEFWSRHRWPAGERDWHRFLLPSPAAGRLVDAYQLDERVEVDAVPARWPHMTPLRVGPNLSLGNGAQRISDDSALDEWIAARHPRTVTGRVGRIGLVDQVQDTAGRVCRWTHYRGCFLTGAVRA